MNPNRKAFYPDVLIVIFCLTVLVWFLGYNYGQYVGESHPKVCAKVLGMTPVSSTATECTYVMGVQGKAYWKYLAEREAKK